MYCRREKRNLTNKRKEVLSADQEDRRIRQIRTYLFHEGVRRVGTPASRQAPAPVADAAYRGVLSLPIKASNQKKNRTPSCSSRGAFV